MHIINRTALVVRPTQHYADWANSLDDDGPRYDINNQPEYTVYLIKEVEGDPTDLERVLRPYYKQIFEEQLMGWHLVEDDWPKRRGLKTFLRWFEVEVNTVVLDLERGGIFRESWD